jgi:hypothetical protein
VECSSAAVNLFLSLTKWLLFSKHFDHFESQNGSGKSKTLKYLKYCFEISSLRSSINICNGNLLNISHRLIIEIIQVSELKKTCLYISSLIMMKVVLGFFLTSLLMVVQAQRFILPVKEACQNSK